MAVCRLPAPTTPDGNSPWRPDTAADAPGPAREIAAMPAGPTAAGVKSVALPERFRAQMERAKAPVAATARTMAPCGRRGSTCLSGLRRFPKVLTPKHVLPPAVLTVLPWDHTA